MRDVQEPVLAETPGKEDAEVFGEGHGDGGDGAGLDNEEQGPAIEEPQSGPKASRR